MSFQAEQIKTAKREEVKEYYGKTLQKSADLKTNVCTTPSGQGSDTFRQLVKDIHPDVISKYYGCGIPIPDCLEGIHVLDLGSGSGRDCFIISKLVGPNGFVTGIDMTDEQVEFAKNYIPFHTSLYGYTAPNVNFITGYIEDLASAGLKSETIDLAISNCVINLSPDKEAVLKEVYRVLKVGGEFYFNDVYSDKRVSEEQKENKVLWGECISGALFWKDFIDISLECGFAEPRLVESHSIDIINNELKPKLGDLKFISATYRLLKLPKILKPPGKIAYLGTIAIRSDKFLFDQNITFKTNEEQAVDVPVATFLASSRYREHFKYISENISTENVPNNKVNPFENTGSCSSNKKPCCC